MFRGLVVVNGFELESVGKGILLSEVTDPLAAVNRYPIWGSDQMRLPLTLRQLEDGCLFDTAHKVFEI